MNAKSMIALLGLAWTCAGAAHAAQAAGPAHEATPAASAEQKDGALDHCAAPLGTLTVVEDLNQLWLSQTGQRHKLQSAAPLLRTLAEQSNCFAFVNAGRPGAVVAADYTVSPAVHFSEHGTNKLGSMALGMLGSVGSAVANSAKTQDAASHLLVIDNRAGQMLAAADGNASAHNWDPGTAGNPLGAGQTCMGDYGGTAEGKLLTAAFIDAFNRLVQTVRAAQAASVASAAQAPGPAPGPTDGAPVPAGTVPAGTVPVVAGTAVVAH